MCDDADSCVTGLLHTASGPSPDVANLADVVCADDADPPAASEPIVCRKRIVRDSWTCPICNYDTGKHKPKCTVGFRSKLAVVDFSGIVLNNAEEAREELEALWSSHSLGLTRQL